MRQDQTAFGARFGTGHAARSRNSLPFVQSLAESWHSFPAPRRIPLRTLCTRLVKNDAGVTAIEYALIAALIAVAAIAAFSLVGSSLSTTFTNIANSL
jgi:pilus assembly protein Flp/PilA